MIQKLAEKYNKHIAYSFFLIFYVEMLAAATYKIPGRKNYFRANTTYKKATTNNSNTYTGNKIPNEPAKKANAIYKKSVNKFYKKPNIGGPASPEASSFQAVGSDNLVNLFSGDFSYSIPLLDVGGYPVNLFYTGGIGMEQEASWVGLGWNINPGSVSRNMRGVPDDFNGEDKLIQEQNVKPNRTWGGEVGIDGEVLGLKNPKINLSLGFSYNNYLGPAIDLGGGISVSLLEALKFEKVVPDDSSAKGGGSGGSLSLGLNFKLNSRSGMTFSPSLNASLPMKGAGLSTGLGLSVDYNSRTGIQDLNISSQMSQSKGYTYKRGKDTYSSGYGMGRLSAGVSLSYARPTYVPTLRTPMENATYTGQLELGAGMFGLRVSATGKGYYTESKVPNEYKRVEKPLYGFMFSERALNDRNGVMDFNRVNDGAVTPNTPIISAPQYAHDVFSIQGEGTGGSIRAYRSEVGYMKDNLTQSKDKSISIGFDIAPAGHFGGNWNEVRTPTTSGSWDDGTNMLKNNLKYLDQDKTGGSFENVYFRNPGESTVTNESAINKIGGNKLARFALEGSNSNTIVASKLQLFEKGVANSYTTQTIRNDVQQLKTRDKRTQVTTFLNAADASKIGLDKKIRNYSGFFGNNFISFGIERVGGPRKAHHISQIDVLEQTGMRYVYGLPVYNTKQKDYTFSTASMPNADNHIEVASNEENVNSPHMANQSRIDGYVMTQETPPYATSFLLSGLLSPDYVDLTDNGITEDDLGGAVKFNYTQSGTHKWRTPRGNNGAARTAHFNDGLKSEKKDNKATISYGEREVWYMNSIESKSMIAIFTTEYRKDAKGVNGELDGKINTAEDVNKRIQKIDLYTKAEIKAKGINNARPIKTVHFDYDYSLCKGTPDNIHSDSGKLTLRSVYFSYNGQSRFSKDRYVFNYGKESNATNPTAGTPDNPRYANNASDRWGTYKDANVNPVDNKNNVDFPYSDTAKGRADISAGAWNLKKILLPSGGQMEIEYESDDYAYVQNRRAANMFNIIGMGQNATFSNSNELYRDLSFLQTESGNALGDVDKDFVYIKLPQPITSLNSKNVIFEKYLQGSAQLAFKLMIGMPKGLEPLTVYANYVDYGLCANVNTNDVIYIQLRKDNNRSPLTKSAIGFLVENLTGQAFTGYEIEVDDIKGFLSMAGAMFTNLRNAFVSVEKRMKAEGKAKFISLPHSFVRLSNPYKRKIGGGYRVKTVKVKDNWNKMKGRYGSEYGQDYDYTTTEKINGIETVVSSGVASYEPGIGGDENPFREIVQFSDKISYSNAQYGTIEMPILESLFPAPSVGYSKVTVRSINRKGKFSDSTLRSAIGKQVTEFYTAFDYPTTYAYTPIESKEYHFKNPFNYFYKDIIDRKTISQGFLVETNDMHGKMRSQKAYSESDEKTPLTASYHSYKNTGANGMNDKVSFVHNKLGGEVKQGNMGIDIELMTDVREFKVQSSGTSGQIQTDFFTFVPFPIFAIPSLLLQTQVENKYRAVACTKLVNYHAIEDSVIVMDKGSTITTKTIAYDAETGSPIVTQTANEFKDPIYNISYPAYWAYSGMSLAYENIDHRFTDINFENGKIINLTTAQQNEAFESGDELYLTSGTGKTGCLDESVSVDKLWAFDKNKNNTPLTVVNKDLVFIDSVGNLYNRNNVSCRIVRSGKRNNIGAALASFTTMKEPFVTTGNIKKLDINNLSNVVSASAMEYKEKWQTDNELFKKYKLEFFNNLLVNGDFELGNTAFSTDYYNSPTDRVGIAGDYVVGDNPSSFCACSNNFGDHTSGSGKMLIVDGHNMANKNVWSQTITVLPNTTYYFTGWHRNTGKTPVEFNPVADLYIYINDILLPTGVLTNSASWAQFVKTWNSGTATTATIKIIDNTLSADGNNFELDDLYFGRSATSNSCNSEEVEYCDGYLEKKINPYIKGLVGNFKSHRSYTYYADRNETIASTTNIRKNGYLKDFYSYWVYDGNSNLVPNNPTNKWVWNSEITKVNSKGQELETKNALNIYTAAQYGFLKSQTTAVANNSRVNEMFAESFEDNNYGESINNNGNYSNSCAKKHIDFGVGNVFKADDLGFKAHTGRNILRVQPGVKSVAIKNNFTTDTLFTLNIEKDTARDLNQIGGNLNITYQNIGTNSQPSVLYKGNTLGVELSQQLSIPPNTQRGFNYETIQYFTLPVCTTINLSSIVSGSADFPSVLAVNLNWDIIGLNNQFVNPILISSIVSSNLNQVKQYSINLQPGLYYLKTKYNANHYNSTSTGPNFSLGVSYYINTSIPSNTYKNLTTDISCIYNKPIPATDSMMNPIFSPAPDKKMWFSAWVREECPTPCNTPTYTNSKVQLQFNDGSNTAVDIVTKGAIIDGWQKIEGEFIIPATATTMDIKLINNGSTPNYWDDIRIHPFNSNMKSYVYDDRNLRLLAELDENNYAAFYEYDEEGQLIRVKKETIQGVKTIKETRSAKQKAFTTIQE
jgi:hypothetical protein